LLPLDVIRLKYTKFDFGWGSVPDPAGGADSAPPDPLTGFEGVLLLREGKGMGGKGRGKGKKRKKGGKGEGRKGRRGAMRGRKGREKIASWLWGGWTLLLCVDDKGELSLIFR